MMIAGIGFGLLLIGAKFWVFTLGAIGVLIRRNAIIIFMSVELIGIQPTRLRWLHRSRTLNHSSSRSFPNRVNSVPAGSTSLFRTQICASGGLTRSHDRSTEAVPTP